MDQLIEVWGHWTYGDRTDQLFLWGLSMLWWGRIGKLLELAAGLTVVAEIVGPERLRGYAHSLHELLSAEQVSDLWKRLLHWIWLWVHVLLARGSMRRRYLHEFRQQPFNRANLIVAVPLGLALAWREFTSVPHPLPSDVLGLTNVYGGFLISWFASWVLSSWLFAPVLIFVLTSAILLVDIVIIQPVARFL